MLKDYNIETAKAFASAAHGLQMYGDKPYTYHLKQVVALAKTVNPDPVYEIVAWLHDTIEDTSTTFEDIEREFGYRVAELVLLVTDEAGSNRRERKAKTNKKLFDALDPYFDPALAVKACDRLANVRERTKNGMYRKEHPEFKRAVYRPGLCDHIWKELDQLLEKEES